MHQYGYYIRGEKVVLGTVDNNKLNQKQKEINHANKIDPASRWFIEPVSKPPLTKEAAEILAACFPKPREN